MSQTGGHFSHLSFTEAVKRGFHDPTYLQQTEYQPVDAVIPKAARQSGGGNQ